MRRRRARGSSFVEFVIVMPLVAVLLATINYFRGGWLTVFGALHQAETDAWKVAMSNDRHVCGTSTPHPLAAVGLGSVGDQAKALALVALPDDSFLYVNGGVHKQATRSMASPGQPFGNAWTSTTRADYMPCNETVATGNDGTLPRTFDVVWLRWVAP